MMGDNADWKARALAAEANALSLHRTIMGLVSGAGGRIVVTPADLYKLPQFMLHRYDRPESGAIVFELRRNPETATTAPNSPAD